MQWCRKTPLFYVTSSWVVPHWLARWLAEKPSWCEKQPAIRALSYPWEASENSCEDTEWSTSTYLTSHDKSKARLSFQQPVCESLLELSILPIVQSNNKKKRAANGAWFWETRVWSRALNSPKYTSPQTFSLQMWLKAGKLPGCDGHEAAGDCREA